MDRFDRMRTDREKKKRKKNWRTKVGIFIRIRRPTEIRDHTQKDRKKKNGSLSSLSVGGLTTAT